MKKLNFLPIAILAIAPVTAFAHKVSYGSANCAADEEQAAYEEIPLCTEEEKEESSATAYCKFVGHPDLENCVQGITSHGMAEAAGKCVDEALRRQADLRDELVGHKVGGGKESALNGHWHIDYKSSKDEGWHRHDWSEAARDKAGAEYATSRVRQAKEASAINKTTSESSTKWDVGGAFKSIFGGPVAEVGIEASANQGGGKTNSVENGPLTEAKAKEIYDKAYSEAKGNPNLSTVNPDILCEKGQPKCSTSFSRDYENEDFQAQGSSNKNDNNTSSSSDGNKSGSTSSSQSGGNKNPTPPTSKSTTEVDVKIDHTPSGTYAGDPSPVTKPDEMIANYEPDNLVNSPISKCFIDELKEQVSKDMSKRYDPNGPNLTPEQRRKEAQGLLRKGICDVKYFGSLYCQKHKTMQLTGKMLQDPQQPDKTNLFEDLQELGKYNFGNPADHVDKTPIDFSRLPKASPDAPATKPIVVPGLK
jgi:hypothetical protein